MIKYWALQSTTSTVKYTTSPSTKSGRNVLENGEAQFKSPNPGHLLGDRLRLVPFCS